MGRDVVAVANTKDDSQLKAYIAQRCDFVTVNFQFDFGLSVAVLSPR